MRHDAELRAVFFDTKTPRAYEVHDPAVGKVAAVAVDPPYNASSTSKARGALASKNTTRSSASCLMPHPH